MTSLLISVVFLGDRLAVRVSPVSCVPPIVVGTGYVCGGFPWTQRADPFTIPDLQTQRGLSMLL